LGGLAVVQQAALLDGLLLDAFALEDDRLSPAEVDVRWGEIVQALVHAAVIVLEPVTESIDETRRFIAAEIARATELLRSVNYQPE